MEAPSQLGGHRHRHVIASQQLAGHAAAQHFGNTIYPAAV
jgi:hypothetical protein